MSMGKCSESKEEDYRMNHVCTNRKNIMEIPYPRKVPMYKTTGCHIPEGCNMNTHHCENEKLYAV